MTRRMIAYCVSHKECREGGERDPGVPAPTPESRRHYFAGHRYLTLTGAIALGVLVAISLLAWLPARAADSRPSAISSSVVSFDAARVTKGEWGEMRRYFTGETFGTKDVLTAVAVVEPGKAVHKAHRHSQEEYLIIAEGSGTWSLAGKEQPANRGDILYVEPWVYHGLTNTGTGQLIFVVVRFNSKGVTPPPRPDDRPDEI